MQRLYNQYTSGFFEDDDWFEKLPFRGGMATEEYMKKGVRELSTLMIEFLIQNNCSKRFKFSAIADFSWRHHGRPRNIANIVDEETMKRKQYTCSLIVGKRDMSNMSYLDSFAPRKRAKNKGNILSTNSISN